MWKLIQKRLKKKLCPMCGLAKEEWAKNRKKYNTCSKKCNTKYNYEKRKQKRKEKNWKEVETKFKEPVSPPFRENVTTTKKKEYNLKPGERRITTSEHFK